MDNSRFLAVKPLTPSEVLDMWPHLADCGTKVFVRVGAPHSAGIHSGGTSDHRMHTGDIVVGCADVGAALEWAPLGARLEPLGWGLHRVVDRKSREEN
jgi:hypothetical protein